MPQLTVWLYWGQGGGGGVVLLAAQPEFKFKSIFLPPLAAVSFGKPTF